MAPADRRSFRGDRRVRIRRPRHHEEHPRVALLQKISRRSTAAVSLSITTIDNKLAHRIEPCAPPPSERFLALRALADAGIEACVALMPVIPFLEDSAGNVCAIVKRA